MIATSRKVRALDSLMGGSIVKYTIYSLSPGPFKAIPVQVSAPRRAEYTLLTHWRRRLEERHSGSGE